MKKQEIFKLQLDAFMKPHVMWRITTTEAVNETPMDVFKDESLWEWSVDIQHDVNTAYWAVNKNFDSLVQEITECFLINVSKKGTEELDNISERDFTDLYWYVQDRLFDIIRDEAFYKDVFDYYVDIHSSLDSAVNDLLK